MIYNLNLLWLFLICLLVMLLLCVIFIIRAEYVDSNNGLHRCFSECSLKENRLSPKNCINPHVVPTCMTDFLLSNIKGDVRQNIF